MQVISSLGYQVCWDENVYRPSDDTLLLMRALDELLAREGARRLLDVGAGTGILALHAVARGVEEVVAVDLSPYAAKAAYCTLSYNGPRYGSSAWHVARCDLTTCLRSLGGGFDVVVFNPPYLPSDGRVGGWIDRAWDGGPTGLEVLGRFLDLLSCAGFGGRTLFVVSSLSGEGLEKLYERLAYHRVVGVMSFFFERLYAVEARVVEGGQACPGGD